MRRRALGPALSWHCPVIAIVHPQLYGVHGIARYVDSFLANLPTDAPPIVLITGTPIGAPRSYRGVEIIHVPLTDSRFSLLTWSLRARRVLRRLFEAERIRCVNLQEPPLIPGLLLPRRIPLVLTAHTTYLGMSGRFGDRRYFESQWNRASLAIKMWMERRILAHSSKVIALTEQGHAEVLSYGYKRPIAVIANGADTQRFAPDPDTPKTLDVLFGGRIERRKGSRPMVQVCKALAAARPTLRIGIVGYGDDEAWVRAQLEPLAPTVELLGKVSFDAMRHHYGRSRVYVSTSYYEGLPGTCLEAMSMSLPVVVWDFLFYRGLVRDGESGFVVPPDDVDTMVQKVLSLIDDWETAARFGQRGREQLEARYDWKNLAREIVHELVATAKVAHSS